jgi:hypothetical protein
MLAVLEELQALGVQVIPDGENLVICPASRVPPELKEKLKAAKPEVLALLKARPATPPKPDKPIECRYDWLPGYRGLRLHCTLHHHAGGTATVFRMTSCGRDVLIEMAELGILSGEALADSQRFN